MPVAEARPVDVPHDEVEAELVQRLVRHCALTCETGAEGPIADRVEQHARARGDEVQRIGHSLVVTPAGWKPGGDRPVVALVGHLDVVAPTDDDRTPRVEQRGGVQVVVGRGTSDMKAGNVVAMDLFERAADAALDTRVDVVLVLYSGEEGPADGNELAGVLERVAWLRKVDLAVVLEPTDGAVQLGCLGGLHATLTVRGRQAHSARPWQGRNAATQAGFLLAAFDALEPLAVEVGPVTFHDVWSITQVATSNGRNLIPGRLDINLNFRFSPTRGLAEAEAELHDVVAGMAATIGLDVEVEVIDRAPPAPPALDVPVLARFVDAVEAPVEAKQAWTDVARFAALGVPALNFGPGRTDQAHQRGEFVETWRLRAVHRQLASVLARLGN